MVYKDIVICKCKKCYTRRVRNTEVQRKATAHAYKRLFLCCGLAPVAVVPLLVVLVPFSETFLFTGSTFQTYDLRPQAKCKRIGGYVSCGHVERLKVYYDRIKRKTALLW